MIAERKHFGLQAPRSEDAAMEPRRRRRKVEETTVHSSLLLGGPSAAAISQKTTARCAELDDPGEQAREPGSASARPAAHYGGVLFGFGIEVHKEEHGGCKDQHQEQQRAARA